MDVQHICEEHIKVPVEVPYPVKEHHPPPLDQHHDKDQVLHNHHIHDSYNDHQPDPQLTSTANVEHYFPLFHDSQDSHPHVHPKRHRAQYDPPHHTSNHPTELHLSAMPLNSELDEAESQHHASSPNYSYDPTPGPKYMVSEIPKIYHATKYDETPQHRPKSRSFHSSPLASALFNQPNRRLSRKKRDFILRGSTRREERDASDEMLTEIVKQVLLDVIGNNQELGEVKATVKNSRSIDPINYQFFLPPPHLHHDPDHHHPLHPHPTEPEYPPIITTHELPAPPGCRTIATKECHKIPVIIPKKVPFEVCNKVPDVDCFIVLKNVTELECTPEIYRDCNDVERKIPYLVPDEECEEITFDECVDVSYYLHFNACTSETL